MNLDELSSLCSARDKVKTDLGAIEDAIANGRAAIKAAEDELAQLQRQIDSLEENRVKIQSLMSNKEAAILAFFVTEKKGKPEPIPARVLMGRKAIRSSKVG